jgi:tRNA A-37 threonylcarbamoyl transferase component Bud32
MTTPLGKYKLVKLIAAGGMAEVYLAKQAGAAGFEKLVCLKRILPHLARDKQFVDMFLNEARLAARLDHPNIVSIFDLGETNGNYFIAMEFIDGPNLRSVGKRAAELNELLPVPEVVKIISMAAAGLQYAHDLTDENGQPLGLVHRDISPDNILVHRNGAAKVVDFGIAKAANSSGATRTGTLKGKVAYMPPEQLRGSPLDRRTDVFALGVVLYEMLAGKRPWDANSEVALIGKIMSEDAPPLAELRPDVPEELLAIVDRALAKDRDQRYQSCHELQNDLEHLLVNLGQTITPTRVADFIKAYAPEVSTTSAAEVTDATLGAVQEESFAGTGAVPQLIAQQRPAPEREAGTLVLDAPVAPPPRSRALLSGIAAFSFIAVLGAGAALFFLKGPGDDQSAPVAVERATIVEQPKAVTPPPPEPTKVVVEEPVKPKPASRRVAVVESPPAPPPVVVIKEAPRPAAPPPPAVTAKGELMLLIRPWAKVEVDGHEIGVTPLADPVILAAGDHQVRLINPDLGKDITRTVHIVASERNTLKEILDE